MKNLIATMLLLSAGAALANPNQRPDQRPDGDKRPGPPPEALEVCKGKVVGTAVEMKTPRGDKVKGVCRMVMIPEQDGRRPER